MRIIQRALPLLLALAPAGAPGPAAAPPAAAAAADRIAAEALARGISGLAIGIARRGTVILERGYGRADAHTRFRIGSLTKTVTAAAILQLADQKTLRLDDPLGGWLPDAPPALRPITVRQLLSHTAGLGESTLANLPPPTTPAARRRVLAELARRAQPPGVDWKYSNAGYHLLGWIVEAASGEPWEHVVTEHVLRPAGVTGIEPCDARGEGSWLTGGAAGGLCARVGDLLRWQAALDGPLCRGIADTMRRPTRLADGTVVEYGAGLRFGTLEGRPAAGHSGAVRGYTAVLLHLPGDGLTIAVLTNGGGDPSARVIAARLARALLDLPPEPARAPGNPPPDRRLAGAWITPRGAARVRLEGGRAVLERHGARVPLVPLAASGWLAGEETIVTLDPATGRIAETEGGLFSGFWRRP